MVKIVRVILFSSLALIVGGYVLQYFEPDSSVAITLKFFSWIIFLIAVGYLSTPNNSRYGKFAFGSVIIMILGIVMKILHLAWANEIIILGLVGIVITYAMMWFRETKEKAK